MGLIGETVQTAREKLTAKKNASFQLRLMGEAPQEGGIVDGVLYGIELATRPARKAASVPMKVGGLMLDGFGSLVGVTAEDLRASYRRRELDIADEMAAIATRELSRLSEAEYKLRERIKNRGSLPAETARLNEISDDQTRYDAMRRSAMMRALTLVGVQRTDVPEGSGISVTVSPELADPLPKPAEIERAADIVQRHLPEGADIVEMLPPIDPTTIPKPVAQAVPRLVLQRRE